MIGLSMAISTNGKKAVNMFKTNIDKIVDSYNKRLIKELGKKGIPLAATFTLNEMANQSMKISRREFKKGRVIRSNWTEKGIRFEQTKRGLPIRKMESRSGNIRDYGAIQETGGTVTADRQFLPIPALGARISKSKRKRIAKKFNMKQLRKMRRLPNVSGTAKRKFAAMLNLARKEKYYGPFLITKKDAGGFKMPIGIFNLSAKGRGRRGGGKITMIRKLQKSARVPGNPYILPAAVKVGKKMDRIYTRQAKRVLMRFGRDIR